MKINSLLANEAGTKRIEYDNFEVINTEFVSSRALISTQNLITNTDLVITFNSMRFDNITFEESGRVLEMMHQLPSSVVISNSTFNNINSGSIFVEGEKSGVGDGTGVSFEG